MLHLKLMILASLNIRTIILDFIFMDTRVSNLNICRVIGFSLLVIPISHNDKENPIAAG